WPRKTTDTAGGCGKKTISSQPDFLDDGVPGPLRRELALHQEEAVHAHPRQLSSRRCAEGARCAPLAPGLHARDGEMRVERPLLERESGRAQPPGEERREMGQLRSALPRAEPQDARPARIREGSGP